MSQDNSRESRSEWKNRNIIYTDGWSNVATRKMYDLICKSNKQSDPRLQQLRDQHYHGLQCGGCSFYAQFNSDWGLCCHHKSRHHLETVFEHYTCVSFVNEGWGPHSFHDNPEHHCWCRGSKPSGPAREPLNRHSKILETKGSNRASKKGKRRQI